MIWKAATIFSAGILGSWLGLMAWDREAPTEIYSTQAVPDKAKPGDRIEIEFMARRHRACRLHVVRFIYDAHGVRHVLSDLDFPAGSLPLGDETFRVLIDLPKNVAAGPAAYQSSNTFSCNWLQILWPITDSREAKFTITQE